MRACLYNSKTMESIRTPAARKQAAWFHTRSSRSTSWRDGGDVGAIEPSCATSPQNVQPRLALSTLALRTIVILSTSTFTP